MTHEAANLSPTSIPAPAIEPSPFAPDRHVRRRNQEPMFPPLSPVSRDPVLHGRGDPAPPRSIQEIYLPFCPARSADPSAECRCPSMSAWPAVRVASRRCPCWSGRSGRRRRMKSSSKSTGSACASHLHVRPTANHRIRPRRLLIVLRWILVAHTRPRRAPSGVSCPVFLGLAVGWQSRNSFSMTRSLRYVRGWWW